MYIKYGIAVSQKIFVTTALKSFYWKCESFLNFTLNNYYQSSLLLSLDFWGLN